MHAPKFAAHRAPQRQCHRWPLRPPTSSSRGRNCVQRSARIKDLRPHAHSAATSCCCVRCICCSTSRRCW
eukprot:8011270-Pyramimonas_sp.AAC.1